MPAIDNVKPLSLLSLMKMKRLRMHLHFMICLALSMEGGQAGNLTTYRSNPMGDIYFEGVTRIVFSKIETNFLDPHHHREMDITLDTGQVFHAVLSSHDREVLEIIDCESFQPDEGDNNV